ncbi:MAG: GGDEF domain-containing protein, partial [Rhodocyclaceae bacterium]|nr:GGDEF domain-containing protein [Rhodocyclaceae bacterium]
LMVPFVAVYLREAGPVLEARRLMEHLRENALRDPMTGLYNRRFLEEYVSALVGGTQRRKSAFSVLMDTGADGAMKVAEKIRGAVEATKVPVPGGILQKTISIGVAEFPKDSDAFWQVVKFADVALYRAKSRGRNRVVRFAPEMWDADAHG